MSKRERNKIPVGSSWFDRLRFAAATLCESWSISDRIGGLETADGWTF